MNKFITRMAERFSLEIDKDFSEREALLFIYKKVYNRSLYDNLAPWNMEYNGGQNSGEYIPLARRRPSVIYGIPKIIVNESVSMLFGDSHFPLLRGKEQNQTDLLDYISRQCDLKSKMLSAAKKGSIGSVCIVVKVLNRKFFLDVLETVHLTPVFDEQEPCKLINLIEKVKVTGDVLMSRGYDIEEKDKNAHFYLIREWNETEEIYFLPYKVDKEKDKEFMPSKDAKRSVEHELGFVPAVWIKNTEECHKIDGECTFEPIIDLCVEIDYQLSQLGRLLKYNSDPTLVIKDPSQLSDQQLIKGIGPITLGENGDAWMLEMTSGSTNAVIDYVRCLREFALETVRGNRANPDKLSAIHSGKALQMLNANLIGFVEDLRIAYGENGIKCILNIMIAILNSGKFDVEVGKYMGVTFDTAEDITLEWKDWYPPTPQDDLQEAQALQTYVSIGILSREGALKTVAEKFNVIDIKKELTQAQNDVSVASNVKKMSKNSSQTDKNMSKNVAAQQ